MKSITLLLVLGEFTHPAILLLDTAIHNNSDRFGTWKEPIFREIYRAHNRQGGQRGGRGVCCG